MLGAEDFEQGHVAAAFVAESEVSSDADAFDGVEVVDHVLDELLS